MTYSTSSKLSIGDRVIVASGYGRATGCSYLNLDGRSGEVVDFAGDDSNLALVAFEGFLHGHDGLGLTRSGKRHAARNARFINPDKLTKISPLFDPKNPQVGDVVTFDEKSPHNTGAYSTADNLRRDYGAALEVIGIAGRGAGGNLSISVRDIATGKEWGLWSARFRSVTAGEHERLVAPFVKFAEEEPKKVEEKTAPFAKGDHVVMIMNYMGQHPQTRGTVINVEGGSVRVKFDDWNGGHGGDNANWCIPNTALYLKAAPPVTEEAPKRLASEHLDGKFTGKKWIIAVLDKDGIPRPASKPAIYISQKQAETVASLMAKAHAPAIFAVLAMNHVAQQTTITIPAQTVIEVTGKAVN